MRLACWLGLSCWLLAASDVSAQPNGLDGAERDTWYHLSQGTEFFPLDLFLTLEDVDTGRPFAENLERFGFIPDAAGPANPYGLPVGMTAELTRDLRFSGTRMVGINCAACHTVSLERHGKPVLRVDGGTSQLLLERFRGDLARSTEAVIKNPIRLVRLVSRLVSRSLPLALQTDAKPTPFRAVAQRALANRIATVFDATVPGSADSALGATKKKLEEFIRQEMEKEPIDPARGLVTSEQDPRLNAARAKLKTSLPVVPKLDPLQLQKSLDDTMISEVLITLRLLRVRLLALQPGSAPGVMTKAGPGRVDAFGIARNKLFPEHAASLDAPVRFPFIWTIKDQLKWYHWDSNTQSRQERNTGEALGVGVIVDPNTSESTLRFQNLLKLEELAMKLTPPRWPAAFGAIDEKKAAAGKLLFKERCANCHENVDGSVIEVLGDIKTDEKRVQNIRRPVGTARFFDVLSPKLREVIVKAGGTPEGKANNWRPSADYDKDLPEGYPNRPLPGVWASPPYLHNGSVPNLYELLLPPAQRSKTFPLGHREYDPRLMGYTLTPTTVIFTFDTDRKTNPGNSNDGHNYQNEALTDAQRFELLEYLKTL